MRKYFGLLIGVLLLSACDKHDPILPGTRTAIFDTIHVDVQNKTISDVPDAALVNDNSNCKYTQDSMNVIKDGDRRIFSGFPTKNTVAGNRTPVCSGKYLYAGLTTGELIKLNPKTRELIWVADIFRPTSLTGGSSMVDIVAPIVPYGSSVYVGGLGDAFCRVAATSGKKQWCLDIGVAMPFIIAGDYAFVLSTDNNLYSIRTSDGVVYWRTSVKNQHVPQYKNGVITVGSMRINASDGKIIK